MKKDNIYYIKFQATDEETPIVDGVFKCREMYASTNVRLTNIFTGHSITSSDYEDCENFLNNSECYVTVRSISKETNPEYFL